MGAAEPHNPLVLPTDLPVPTDDGACLHLRARTLPAISLPSTAGPTVDLARLRGRPAVLFFYPRTGVPGQPPNLGFSGETWESIPGARGCTPQSCSFRDLHAQFLSLDVDIFGISTNTTSHQLEFKQRNHIPFDFLSDSSLELTRALNLPTLDFPIESGGPNTLLRRMAWYVEPESTGPCRITHVWYPVFPPDRNAETTLRWLHNRRAISIEPIAPSNIAFVRGQLRHHWLSTTIWSIGRPYDADSLPGFVALVDGKPVGHLTYFQSDLGLEVITLASTLDDHGIGSRLLDAAEARARAGQRSHARLFLTTTNDNLRALRFYQRRGMSIAAVHSGMMDRYRDAAKPIPRMGHNGIPLRDEIELEILLNHGEAP